MRLRRARGATRAGGGAECGFLELKPVEKTLSVHEAQVLTYLRLTGAPVGLLINFNVPKLTDGVKRLLNPNRRMFTGGEIDSQR